MFKLEKSPLEELMELAKKAIKDYELYLLDQMGSRELARTMLQIKMCIERIEKTDKKLPPPKV